MVKEDDVYCYDTLPQSFPYKLSASKLSLINFDQSGIISLHVELNIVNLCRHLEHRRGFQDVVPIQMLAGCTSGISSALIG